MSDDFFANPDEDRKKEVDDFFKEMSRPKEKMEEDPERDAILRKLDGEDEEDGQESETTGNTQESDNSNSLGSVNPVNEGHLLTTQFLLNSYNQMLAFGLSLWSGEAAERYLIYKEKPPIQNQEVELGAMLVEKYMSGGVSIEAMFFMSMFFVSIPVINKARVDLRKKEEKEEEEQLKNYQMQTTDYRFRENQIQDAQIIESGKKAKTKAET